MISGEKLESLLEGFDSNKKKTAFLFRQHFPGNTVVADLYLKIEDSKLNKFDIALKEAKFALENGDEARAIQMYSIAAENISRKNETKELLDAPHSIKTIYNALCHASPEADKHDILIKASKVIGELTDDSTIKEFAPLFAKHADTRIDIAFRFYHKAGMYEEALKLELESEEYFCAIRTAEVHLPKKLKYVAEKALASGIKRDYHDLKKRALIALGRTKEAQELIREHINGHIKEDFRNSYVGNHEGVYNVPLSKALTDEAKEVGLDDMVLAIHRAKVDFGFKELIKYGLCESMLGDIDQAYTDTDNEYFLKKGIQVGELSGKIDYALQKAILLGDKNKQEFYNKLLAVQNELKQDLHIQQTT